MFWTGYERFEPAGPMLLESPRLADGTNIRGDVSREDGRLILRVLNPKNRAGIDFPLPTAAVDYKYLRVRTRIQVEGVVTGRYHWSRARLLLAQYDARNEWIPGIHSVVMKDGTLDWEEHEKVFERTPRTVHMAVVVQQWGVEGTARFDRITVEPVKLQSSFFRWRNLFALLWLLTGVFYFRRCRLHSRRLRVLIILNVLVILTGTLMPGKWINANMVRAHTVVREMLSFGQEPEEVQAAPQEACVEKPQSGRSPVQRRMNRFAEMEIQWYQVGHFILFASLCFLVYLSAALERQHPVYFIKVGADVLLFAAVTESLQFLTLDRRAGVGDLWTDIYGMAAALLLFLAVLPVIRCRLAKAA